SPLLSRMPCSTFQRQNPARTRRSTGSPAAALETRYFSSPVRRFRAHKSQYIRSPSQASQTRAAFTSHSPGPTVCRSSPPGPSGLPPQPARAPGLRVERRAVPHQVIGPAGLPAGPGPAAEAAERLGHLADVALLPPAQALQVTGLVAVALVEGQPVEDEAVGPGAVQLLQGDPPLGPVADVAGDAGLVAAIAVRV